MRDLFKELFRSKLYKNSQGRIVRRLTMIGVIAAIFSGAYKFYLMSMTGIPFLAEDMARGVVAGLICLLGAWFAFRLVNWSTFADFLISVEAEMLKVSWPGKAELYSSTVVVLTMFVILAAMIRLFDVIWLFVFKCFGIM